MKLSANNRRRKDLFTLSPADQAVLESIGWKEKLVDIDKAILANARFLSGMVSNPEIFIGLPPAQDEGDDEHGMVDAIQGLDVSQRTGASSEDLLDDS